MLLSALLSISLVPSVLWLGGRYWSWLDRLEGSRREQSAAETGPLTASQQGVCRLNARSDAVQIDAAERCCADRRLIRYCVTDSARVVIEVDGTTVAMLASFDQSEPPT